jgi:topoisomerase-4 subunit A
LKANDKGKIKIKKVIDNTAQGGRYTNRVGAWCTDPDVTVDALFAFTDCQTSISTNACLIVEDKPVFMTVDEVLRISTENTKELPTNENSKSNSQTSTKSGISPR